MRKAQAALAVEFQSLDQRLMLNTLLDMCLYVAVHRTDILAHHTHPVHDITGRQKTGRNDGQQHPSQPGVEPNQINEGHEKLEDGTEEIGKGQTEGRSHGIHIPLDTVDHIARMHPPAGGSGHLQQRIEKTLPHRIFHPVETAALQPGPQGTGGNPKKDDDTEDQCPAGEASLRMTGRHIDQSL